MQNYRYTGINRFGRRVKGEIQASNSQDLEKRLDAANIDLLSFKVKKGSLFSGFTRKKIHRRDIITVTSQFRQLLKAGVPLMEVLDDLRQTYESDAVREMMSGIYESMEGGENFSQALKAYENSFGRIYVSLVAVGEKTGQLEEVMKNLEAMIKWEESLAAKAKKVMIYPAIVGTVVIGVVMLMMIFVVPQLLSFIKDMGGELGFATSSLVATSGFIQNNLIWILVAPFLIYGGLKWWLSKSESFRIKFDQSLFSFYIIGPVLYKLKIARMASSLEVMYGAGVSFTESTRLSMAVANNAYLEKNIENAIRLIEDGEKIYLAFDQAKVFPSMAIRMIRVGEQSGNMDEALRNISEYYDTEAKDMIDKIEPAIEPVLTVVMATVVGWVMMAVLGPVYDTISKVP